MQGLNVVKAKRSVGVGDASDIRSTQNVKKVPETETSSQKQTKQFLNCTKTSTSCLTPTVQITQ